MTRRSTPARRTEIMALLEERGEISVEALARYFSTSEVTIRKDLALLEHQGLLIRRYGGAALIPRTDQPSVVSPVKLAIAKAARQRIRDHARIIIDSGSTTSALIPELRDVLGLVVMTNSLAVANAIRELDSRPALLMTGGTWDERSCAFQGQVAEQVLRAYDFDQLFIGADGIDPERGTTTFNELLHLSRVMAEVAREVVVMIESDKLGRRIPNLELAWSAIDVLITDEQISDELFKKITAQGVNVVRAQMADTPR